jgi:hypothetical protein
MVSAALSATTISSLPTSQPMTRGGQVAFWLMALLSSTVLVIVCGRPPVGGGPVNSASGGETGRATMMTTSIRLHCETVDPPGP